MACGAKVDFDLERSGGGGEVLGSARVPKMLRSCVTDGASKLSEVSTVLSERLSSASRGLSPNSWWRFWSFPGS